MTLIITDELLKKIERLKEVLPEGHGNRIADIIEKSVSIALRRLDPLLKRETKERGKPQPVSQPQSRSQPQQPMQLQPKNPTSSNAYTPRLDEIRFRLPCRRHGGRKMTTEWASAEFSEIDLGDKRC